MYLETLGKLAESGVTITMVKADLFSVDGFYKSDTVLVDLTNKTITARYNEVTTFDEDSLFETLVRLNYQWWTYSSNRLDGWKSFNHAWANFLTEIGYTE